MRNVFRNAQRGNQRKVLVYHANPVCDCCVGRINEDRFSINPNLSRIGSAQAVDCVHECRLTRSIFTQYRMNLTPAQRKVHPIDGEVLSKCLGDAAKLKSECCQPEVLPLKLGL
jgi:hypothetical protein